MWLKARRCLGSGMVWAVRGHVMRIGHCLLLIRVVYPNVHVSVSIGADC